MVTPVPKPEKNEPIYTPRVINNRLVYEILDFEVDVEQISRNMNS